MDWKHILVHRYLLRKGLIWILTNVLIFGMITGWPLVDKMNPNMSHYIVIAEVSDFFYPLNNGYQTACQYSSESYP